MPLPVTAFVAAVCALLLLVTAIDTVRQRLRLKAAFGDHGDPKLISASRAHGNLAEYAPITIILLGLLETVRADHMALMILGAIFLIGRVAHIVGTGARKLAHHVVQVGRVTVDDGVAAAAPLPVDQVAKHGLVPRGDSAPLA